MGLRLVGLDVEHYSAENLRDEGLESSGGKGAAATVL